MIELLLKTVVETEKGEQIKIRGGRGGDTGEEVVKYCGWGVDTMGGRGKKEIRREQAKEFVRN